MQRLWGRNKSAVFGVWKGCQAGWIGLRRTVGDEYEVDTGCSLCGALTASERILALL